MNPINDLLKVSFENIKSMIDVDVIIGKTIMISDVISVIPVSRVKTTFISGGSEFNSKRENQNPFGGASGGGIVLEPVCFIVINGSEVSLMSANNKTSILEKVLDDIPLVVSSIKTK